MKNPSCFGKRGTKIALLLIVMIITSLFLIQAQEERKGESTIFLVDCSQSMVAGIHKDMESKGLLKMYTSGHDLLFSLPSFNLYNYLKKPANEGVISESLMFKACEDMEKMIEEIKLGPVEIITFHEGPVDLDRGGPFTKVFSGYIDPNNPEGKKKILQFINPAKYGKSDIAPLWNGILWETIKRGGGPTRINTSCKYAMNLFNKKLKKPGFRDKLKYQRLVVFTDGKEMEKKSDFKKVRSLYELEPKGNWYEYREKYVVEKKETPIETPTETPVVVTQKAKIGVSANSLKGSLKEDDLSAPAFKGVVKLSPALRINVSGEGDFIPGGSVSVSFSKQTQEAPFPKNTPTSIKKKDFGKDVAIKLTYEGIKPFLGTLLQEKEVKGMINLEYKPASGEEMKKQDIPRLSIPVSVKMIPEEKLVRIIPPAGFEAKSAPDGIMWVMSDASKIKGEYSFSADFSKAPKEAKLEVELREDQKNKGVSLKKGTAPGKTLLTPDAGKKASFDIGVDLARTEEKLTGILSAKAMPANVKAIPPKGYISIANPVKVYKILWKNQQKQDMAAPQAIDYGKVKIKKIKTGEYQRPKAQGFAIQPELGILASINTPVDAILEGNIREALLLKIEGAGTAEALLTDCSPNKTVAFVFRENLKPGKYTGTLVIKTDLDRVEIKPTGKTEIPIQIEIVGPGYLWLIIIIIVLLLLIILFAMKGKRQEQKPRAPIARPQGGEQ